MKALMRCCRVAIAVSITRAVINSTPTRIVAIARLRRFFWCWIDVCFSRARQECLTSRRPVDPVLRRRRAQARRAARARSEEKQRKKDEKAALRKAERAAAESAPDDKQS